ncbi:GNAT family N-acetyltransferase [Nakamurella multipartita]|nr:GNAT family N-acetyltransferase [Nakamurella multipartita]
MQVQPDQDLFNAVFELGESHKKSVGMLPMEAWRDYACRDGLIAAIRGTVSSPTLLGFAAFRVGATRPEISLAQMVVSPGVRGGGTARRLIEFISSKHSEMRGIRLKCRRDLPAATLWPRLGFVARGDIPGRGNDGAWLTVWWRDHGHPDLLTWSGVSDSTIAVVLDTNVFIDLHGPGEDGRSKHTRTVLAANDDRIQLLVTPELGNDLNRCADDRVRFNLQKLQSAHPGINAATDLIDETFQELVADAGTAPRSDQDRSDLRHIAYTARTGVHVFLTWDEASIRRWGRSARELHDVAMVTPSELGGLLDELESAPGYTPVALLGTGYTSREAGTADSDTIRMFLDTSHGEKAPEFATRHRQLASGPQTGAHRILFFEPAGAAVAILGYTVDSAVVNVSLMRMHQFPIAQTMAAQLVAMMRVIATEADASVVRVRDRHINPLFADALIADGFHQINETYVGLSVNARSSIQELIPSLTPTISMLGSQEEAAFGTLLDSAQRLTSNTAAEVCSNLERLLRPLRIVDAPLETWLVPIKPHWSAQLFNSPPDLFGQIPELGMSVEHVYYRGGRSGETEPARIIWWVSGPSAGHAIACSELIEVIDGTPSELFRRFRRLGVWTWSEVQAAAATSGQLRALRFINTEMFAHEVPLEPLERQRGRRLRLAFPVKIDPDTFDQIITEARA